MKEFEFDLACSVEPPRVSSQSGPGIYHSSLLSHVTT